MKANWKDAMQRWWRGSVDRAKLQPSTDELPVADLGTDDIRVQNPVASAEDAQSIGDADARRTEKIREWRRRVLLKRGARMYAVMGTGAERSSLAMLDEDGVVVSWYGSADGNRRAADHVVDHHVAQFYVPEDIAGDQPLRDLHAAVLEGTSTRQGWRRRPDGTRFWGTTVIEVETLRDGRVQGFSFVTQGSAEPPVNLSVAQRVPLQEEDADRGVGPESIQPTWDRMAKSRSATRQRRLFRLMPRPRMLALAQHI